MKSRKTIVKTALALLAVVLPASPAAMSGEAGAPDADWPLDAVVAWASAQAVPITSVLPGSDPADLEPLREMIGDARVVMLGDSRHDAREQFLLKHRMIAFLIEEMGFTNLALEESVPQAYGVHDYVMGGEGDPVAAVEGLGGWYLWSTEEIVDLVRWLRRHNDGETSGEGAKAGFHGLDVSDAGLPAVSRVLDYLNDEDPELAAAVGSAIDTQPLRAAVWPQIMENYRRLSPEAADSLGRGLDRLVEALTTSRQRLVASTGEALYDRMLHLARSARAAHELFATGRDGTYVEAGLVRERAMADNLVRLINRAGPEQRIIVWAANPHVARGALDLDIPGAPPASDMRMLGQLLLERTDAEVVTVGFAFGRGTGVHANLPAADPETLDGVLASAEEPHFMLDLRTAPASGPVRQWLHEPQRMRTQGGHITLVPAEAFDILVFTETVDRTRPTSGALERLKELGG